MSVERRIFSFQTVFRLAKALGVEVKVLTDYDGELPDNTGFKRVGELRVKRPKR